MLVKRGSVIRHKRFMDVACFVISRHYSTFKVGWINMGYVDSYFLNIPQTLKIRDLSNWQICVDKDPWCYRYARWVDL